MVECKGNVMVRRKGTRKGMPLHDLTLQSYATRIANMDTPMQPLNVTIKRIDPTLPLPTYATAGSVGFDLICREDTEIEPRTIELIPANVIVRIPDGYMLLLTMRSSTPIRKGVRIAQGIFVPVARVSWQEVSEMGTGRGGFGSTGA